MRTFWISTLGCKVNQYESEQIMTLLRSRGLALVDNPREADLRVINTCAVTIQAASKSRQTARQVVRLPVLGGSVMDAGTPREGRTIVMGCWASSDPARASSLGGVSAVIGHHDDVAGELDRLITLWQAEDSEPPVKPIDPQTSECKPKSAGNEGWMIPASTLTRLAAHNKPQYTDEVKEKDARKVERGAAHPGGTEDPSPCPLAGVPGRGERGTEHGGGALADKLPVAHRAALADELPVAHGRGSHVRLSSAEPPPWPSPAEYRGGGERGSGVPGRGEESARVPGRGTAGLPLLGGHQSGHQRAFLKIQDGCDAHCTYCIIPRLRPALWSKSIEDVVSEARRLVDAGHLEIVLTGIFLGAYGQETALRRRQRSYAPTGLAAPRMPQTHGLRHGLQSAAPPGLTVGQAPPYALASGPPTACADGLHSDARAGAPAGAAVSVALGGLPGATVSPLARVIEAICTQVDGLRRLRLSSLEPGDLTQELIEVLRSHPQAVPHFHLPLQSGSDALLRRMNRQYRREDYLRMIERVREAFDRPGITTDIIVGFPGESDEEFERTAEVAEAAGFIHIHAFPFSPRPGTAAARWREQFVRGPVVNERIERLRMLAEKQSLEFRRGFVGEVVEVMVERPSAEERSVAGAVRIQHGRCPRYFSVHFEHAEPLTGRCVAVKIDRVTSGRTHGTLAYNPPR